MTAANVAIVMGPNLIWSNDKAASLVGKSWLQAGGGVLLTTRAIDMGTINGYTAFLVTHFEECFLSD